MSPGKVNLSNQMRQVFDHHDDMDDDGIITGGEGKLMCLTGRGNLNPRTIRDLVKTPCKNIIEELRSLFDDLYRHVPASIDKRPEMQEIIQSDQDQDEAVQTARKKLQSSEGVLAIINKHLASNWDLDNDGSPFKFDLGLETQMSRCRRKRKAANDGRNFNELRRGRFPPSNSSQLSGMFDLQLPVESASGSGQG